MNASRSIFTVPSSFHSKDDSSPQARRPIKRSRSSSTQPTTHSTAPSSFHTDSESVRSLRRSSTHLEANLSTAWSFVNNAPDAGLHSLPENSRPPLTRDLSGWGAGQPPHKKLRHQSQPRRAPGSPNVVGRVYEEHERPPPPSYSANEPRSRPALPYRLSNPDAGAAMLGKPNNKEEAGKVKTLRLARGTPTSPGRPSRPVRTPSGQSHSSSSSKLRSPTEETKPASLSILHQIGIPELLDQDDRPTFIIDLGNHANLEPGPLKIVFSNFALKLRRA